MRKNERKTSEQLWVRPGEFGTKQRSRSETKGAGALHSPGKELGQSLSREGPILSPARSETATYKRVLVGRIGKIGRKY